jgi:hypothetical protein
MFNTYVVIEDPLYAIAVISVVDGVLETTCGLGDRIISVLSAIAL